jgi:hypothetical protein
LKALADPKHKIRFPKEQREFTEVVVRHMHDRFCDDYATKTLNAMINHN